MSENKRNVNVFMIETPYQLLNAIEAVNSLKLSNNILIVISKDGLAPEAFKPLIIKGHWTRVHYVPLSFAGPTRSFGILGPRVAEEIVGYYCDYQQFLRRRRLNKIAKSLKKVDSIFLGHYWAEYKPYMRHFANTLKHRTLYLLDDGTDIIEVNRHRKSIAVLNKENPPATVDDAKSLWRRIKHRIRRNYFDWDNREAQSVTFFTAYALDIREGDRLVKNEYNYLRGLGKTAKPNNEVFFLGQCLVEDKYMKQESYLQYLTKVKAYFDKDEIEYIPHPRQSDEMLNRIQEDVGLPIKRLSVPIEYEITVRGNIPKVIASFFCSALESCLNILGEDIKIMGFYIYPEDLMLFQDNVKRIYEYFEKKVNPNLTMVKL